MWTHSALQQHPNSLCGDGQKQPSTDINFPKVERLSIQRKSQPGLSQATIYLCSTNRDHFILPRLQPEVTIVSPPHVESVQTLLCCVCASADVPGPCLPQCPPYTVQLGASSPEKRPFRADPKRVWEGLTLQTNLSCEVKENKHVNSATCSQNFTTMRRQNVVPIRGSCGEPTVPLDPRQVAATSSSHCTCLVACELA